ncbi:hypothetical protein RJ640_030400 [Escallonia rubra]|uniref:Plastocyanin-like domain-containing protein n=1 Tax=Escallonia rubra TaxID=112253 RepID=A0AA88U187_9ASTE|nr:hypothetical protein RJ640_030400 [Escallonia rubra]
MDLDLGSELMVVVEVVVVGNGGRDHSLLVWVVVEVAEMNGRGRIRIESHSINHVLLICLIINLKKFLSFGSGQWNSTMRKRYNLADATTRYTVQVYPFSWSAILVSMDNKGMWNLRSAIWPRRYLGQELYIRVSNDERSLFTDYEGVTTKDKKLRVVARFLPIVHYVYIASQS